MSKCKVGERRGAPTLQVALFSCHKAVASLGFTLELQVN
jgi:hypothetical protein